MENYVSKYPYECINGMFKIIPVNQSDYCTLLQIKENKLYW